MLLCMNLKPFFRAAAGAAAALWFVCLPMTEVALAQRGGGGGRGGGGAEPQAPAGRQPVTFDFVVTGPDGRPVTDLQAGDIQFSVGGRDRDISALAYVGVPGGAVQPPYASSRVDTSRAFYLVFEEQTIDPEADRAMRPAIEAFLAGLAPSDRVGIMTLPAGATALAPTADRAAITAALASISGRASASLGTAVAGAPTTSTAEDDAGGGGGGGAAGRGGLAAPTQAMAPGAGGLATESRAMCLTRDSLQSLRTQLMNLPTSGGFTGVIVFSGGMTAAGLPAPRLDASQADQACEVTAQLYDDVRAAVDARQVHLRVAQPVGLVGNQRSQGLQSFAGSAGAGDVLLVAPNASPLADLLTPWSGYYVASFVPQSGERTDERRRVEIEISRPNVTVDARATLVVGAVGPVVAPPAMLRVPDAFRELPVRATVVPTRVMGPEGEQIRLLVIASADPGVTLASGAMGLVAANNSINAVGVSPEVLAARPLSLPMDTAPGTYRLRFAAVDSEGLGGTADVEVQAQLTSVGPFRFSGILLGAVRDNSLAPQLEFSSEPAALAIAELYGNLAASGTLNLWMELAQTPDGPALQTIAPGGEATAEPDKAMIIGEVPLADLAPGDYVVRLHIEVQGLPERVVMRTLRKVQ